MRENNKKNLGLSCKKYIEVVGLSHVLEIYLE